VTDFVVAEAAIRQLHARYADAVWRKDYDAFGDCFAEDAEWRITGLVLRGRAAIVESVRSRLDLNHRVLMTFRTPILTVGDGTASGRTYVTEQNAFKNGRPGSSIAIYFERFVDQGDRWRFSWRLFQLHYLGKADLTDPFFDNPDYGPPPNMPPLDAVPAFFDEKDWSPT
jgi:ketosteroid isomerase-like protein